MNHLRILEALASGDKTMRDVADESAILLCTTRSSLKRLGREGLVGASDDVRNRIYWLTKEGRVFTRQTFEELEQMAGVVFSHVHVDGVAA